MNVSVAGGSFAGAGVEFLEIAAIAYALGKSGYPREAILGTGLGIAAVAAPAVFVWPLFERVPIHWFQLAVGLLLLWLGLSWVLKSVRRKRSGGRAGWVQNPLHLYEGHIEARPAGFSYFNAVVMTKSAAVESFEVCMIVSAIALPARDWVSAVAGAAAALVATLGLVFALHGSLRRVPEVALKFWAGLLLAGIGGFWGYEGVSGWLRAG